MPHLAPSLDENLTVLQQTFADCADFVAHRVTPREGPVGAVLYLEGLVQRELVGRELISAAGVERLPRDAADAVAQSPFLGPIERLQTVAAVADAVLAGNAVLLLDGQAEAMGYGVRGAKGRAVAEPATEPSIRGPKDAFVESLSVNLGLLRRKLRTADLKVKTQRIGTESRTQVAVVYLEGIAEPQVLAEVDKRLSRIQIDGIFDGGYLEQLIEDLPSSPFPQIQNTERPDTLAANLLEGRIGILVDGSPFALLLPAIFAQFLQAADDYYERPMMASAIRLMRVALLFTALLLPSVYVSIVTFHPEMIPSSLLYSIVSAREGVPFPALVEALAMEIAFEVLREAGLRLPRAVGQAVSIVGALVIGQAAVQAGIVSAPMVIVVSFTGIASFAIPRFHFALALRLLRFPFILLAGTLGLFGIVAGLSALLLHLCQLRSFGVPYLTPWAPVDWEGLKDTLGRFPLWTLDRRPAGISRRNAVRQGPGQKPGRG